MSATFQWPHDASAAVSLTYDDGEPDNLDHAIPDLDDAGFRGTFYLYGTCPAAQRIDEWRQAFARGHEIGNHTYRHPCRNDARPRTKPLKNPLENYTADRIADEVAAAADWLDEAIGVDRHRTFAYPCGCTAIGMPPRERPYRDAVAGRHPGARDLRPIVNDPQRFDPLRIGSFIFDANRLDEFLGACRLAIDAGGWTVLTFHSIDGPSHNTDRQVHRSLLAQLQQMPVWVAPVRDVLQHVLGGE